MWTDINRSKTKQKSKTTMWSNQLLMVSDNGKANE